MEEMQKDEKSAHKRVHVILEIMTLSPSPSGHYDTREEREKG
jgi:hypothetical protein